MLILLIATLSSWQARIHMQAFNCQFYIMYKTSSLIKIDNTLFIINTNQLMTTVYWLDGLYSLASIEDFAPIAPKTKYFLN